MPKANLECKEEKQRGESNMKKSKRTASVGHISITFWSPFYSYYMSFRSLRSQESNASNGVQIGAEMKKLWPFEDNCTKLKMSENFASAKSKCENFAPTKSKCEIFALAKVKCKNFAAPNPNVKFS